MFSKLEATQRAGAIALVFFVLFFLALTIGRLLKRRVGVRLGVLYRLFCLTLALYGALAISGFHVSWQGHVGAALVLLGTAVLVSLIDRLLWDHYVEKRRATIVPKLARDTVAMALFLTALLLVLKIGYHAETQLTGLLAGSGVVAIILGFAAQNLLSSIIAGVSLQIQRPYKVGDWLKIGDTYAEVMEIRWGATRLRTNDAITWHIPNNEMAKQTLVNLTYPSPVHAMRLTIGVDYGVPPNRVKDALYHAASQVKGVESEPPVQIFLKNYGDSAIIYEIKFSMTTHRGYYETSTASSPTSGTNFGGAKLPFPSRFARSISSASARRMPTRCSSRRARFSRHEPLFSCLSDEQVDGLVDESEANYFGRGEAVIEEGMEGDSMFILAARRGAGFGFEKWRAHPPRVPARGRLLWRNVFPHRRTSDRHRARGERLRGA